MFKTLFYKEWLQHRWELGFWLFMLVVTSASFMVAGLTSNGETIVIICLFGGAAMAISNAMGVFAPENSAGTATFLLTRPVADWQVFAAKWLVGWINTIAPLLACGVLLLILSMRTGVEFAYRMHNEWRLYRGILPLLTVLYHLTVCLAPRRAGEGQTALTALAIAAIVFVHGAAISSMAFSLMHQGENFGLLAKVISSINPLHFMQIMNDHRIAPWTFWTAQALMFALAIHPGLRKCRAGA